MKGYWHLPTLAVCFSFLSIIYNNNLILVFFFFWLSLLYYFKRIGKIPLLFSLLFLLIFYFYLPNIHTLTANITFPEETVRVSGKIISPLTITEKTLQFTFEETESSTKIQVFNFFNEDLINYTDFSTFKYGAGCQFSGRVTIPEQSTNPGQFDYQSYLLTKGITHQVTLSSLEDISCDGASALDKIFSFRLNLLDYVYLYLKDETAAWLSGLVLGDDSLIEDRTIELFQRWSISHILAISGLHVGLIVGIVYFMLIKLNITTKETAQWFMMFFLPVYALIAGGEPSVWRASMMVFLFIIITKLNMKFSVTDILSIVFLLLIITNKYIVYHIGFQLSFTVTFGIILSTTWISNNHRVWQVLQISFVSQMVILPLLLNYFFIFQPLSILMNVLVVPYFSIFVIPLMFILLLLIPISSSLVSFIEQLFILIHDNFLSLIFLIDKISPSPWVIGKFPPLMIIVYYLMLYLLMKNLETDRYKQAFFSGIAITFVISSIAIQPYLSEKGTVTMLDIGQGDAFVIELPYRKGVIFMDAGSTFSFDTFEPSDRVYKQIIKPFLNSRGINEVDTIMVSHEHVDHIGSISFLAKEMNVQNILISDYALLNEEIQNDWTKHGAQIIRVSKNETINIANQEFTVLSPKRNTTVNDNSLVIYTMLGPLSWLFTGDIGVDIESEIIRSTPNLDVDVLKVAHHGSNTSTDLTFLKTINPQYGLIPVGRDNSYGHPSQEVIQRLSEGEVFILRTDLHGAVEYNFKRNSGTFSTFFPYNELSN